jgi:hypothetical protein
VCNSRDASCSEATFRLSNEGHVALCVCRSLFYHPAWKHNCVRIQDYGVVFYKFLIYINGCLFKLLLHSEKPIFARNLKTLGKGRLFECSKMDERSLVTHAILPKGLPSLFCLSLFCQTFSSCYRSSRSKPLKYIYIYIYINCILNVVWELSSQRIRILWSVFSVNTFWSVGCYESGGQIWMDESHYMRGTVFFLTSCCAVHWWYILAH